MRSTILILVVMMSFTALDALELAGEVVVREEKLSIPTWEIGASAVHSIFSQSQGGRIYPYTLDETLTDNKVDKLYDAVFLENEYIQILVLPEIGGRLHGALDKTNGYVWIYWQRTIKPGLLSMTGAWISGGIEWNFPHGHRPSGFMRVDHRVIRNKDGSATVWVGETEPIYRMRWLVGMTVFPGRSYLRCDYVFINPTNHKHPFQFWATSATHANEYTQAQYPGDMVTGHGKHEFWNWPIHDGVDLTWWKNVPNASSFFAYNNPSDWFGTYDHKADGGMVHVASHQTMPGKKLWTWGSGPSGRIWEDILTEGGGPYFEPQAGAWSDNQPDYHWMWPQEVKTTHDYWYPVRDTRGYHQATKDFAINTDLQDGKAFGAVYSTGVVEGYRVVLKNNRTGRVLTDAWKISISPDRPFLTETAIESDATVYDLYLAVYDPEGNLRIELQQRRPRQVTLPPGQKDPGDPAKMESDELYHAGEWLDKFGRREEALNYYNEALKKDPNDSRVNLEMGFLALKQGRWEEALKSLSIAQERDYDNSRIYFGKGLALVGLGRLEDAYDEFYRATYTYDFSSAAYLNLARLDLRKGHYEAALAKLEEAEEENRRFADIPALRAAAWRHLGRPVEALAAAERAMELDPMHFMGSREKVLSLRAAGKNCREEESLWNGIMRDAVQNYLELSAAYAEAGLYSEADTVLAKYSEGKEAAQLYPMVGYLRGYFQEVQGHLPAASEWYGKGALGPVNYTNPHRLEEKAALEAALRSNPKDARAHLYLGNMLYAMGRRREGFEHWKQATQWEDALWQAWRNVALAQSDLNNDLEASYRAYRKTIALNRLDGRALLEMDEVAERARHPVSQRLALLEQYHDAVSLRDDLVARLADLRLAVGGSDNLRLAYEGLSQRHFHSWEGRYGIHMAWVEVNQKLGDLAFEKKDYALALQYYQRACEYPKNLEVAPRTPDFRAHVFWNLAKVYGARNEKRQADQYLKEILAEQYRKPHLGTYYQALAQKALNNRKAYEELLAKLEARARQYTSGAFEFRGDQEVIGHLLLSLVLEEKGNLAEAEREKRQALERNNEAMRLAIREAQLDLARAHQ
ncbi:MAG: DUF5107 domain-containing protein [Acidobacteriota bacterium]